MINVYVGVRAHGAYVRIENIACPRGGIAGNTRKINAIKAVRTFALNDVNYIKTVFTGGTSRLEFLAGLKEAKDFVETFLTQLDIAFVRGEPMVITSDKMDQCQLEIVVSAIMIHTPCRYDVYIKPGT